MAALCSRKSPACEYNLMTSNYQVIVRVIPGGGCKTSGALYDQLKYLTKKRSVLENINGQFVETHTEYPKIYRSERHQKDEIKRSELLAESKRWIAESGLDLGDDNNPRRDQDLTTHIVVSFPEKFDRRLAEDAGRAWAEEMFGMQQKHGGEYNYFTVLHLNKKHPHVHIVVNRQPMSGRRLKISGSREAIKWETLRKVMAEISYDFNFPLNASSRAERNIIERPITFAEHRRRMRNVSVVPDLHHAGSSSPEASDFSQSRSLTPSSSALSGREASVGVASRVLSPNPPPTASRETSAIIEPPPTREKLPPVSPQQIDREDREERERRKRRRQQLVERSLRQHDRPEKTGKRGDRDGREM
ncbi:relaxase/mobilization nuclease domain-containing protein [Rhizobium sp. CFBP 13644]|uniref:relaxase/mobilization nuclease domain-containing protein n=2 Tax=unclassified Rhizobium TaxID=2613769 RepID=UPI001782A623|nr:relaxase/mobilization nuclease domain-containing protein [Rhizobium sp. CFBP 13644]MBD8689866.1 relaxase/mobilization nuclease domain-containing protein [Rhizobium sp. CFBP 13644]MBD8694455.1 relaxase/mobilization nuclease domain-containing protein [Rhizobium sp. CFBP 13717]